MSKVEEILQQLAEVCEENGLYYLVQIDDGTSIKGRWCSRTNSRLDAMVKAVNALADRVET